MYEHGTIVGAWRLSVNPQKKWPRGVLATPHEAGGQGYRGAPAMITLSDSAIPINPDRPPESVPPPPPRRPVSAAAAAGHKAASEALEVARAREATDDYRTGRDDR